MKRFLLGAMVVLGLAGMAFAQYNGVPAYVKNISGGTLWAWKQLNTTTACTSSVYNCAGYNQMTMFVEALDTNVTGTDSICILGYLRGLWNGTATTNGYYVFKDSVGTENARGSNSSIGIVRQLAGTHPCTTRVSWVKDITGMNNVAVILLGSTSNICPKVRVRICFNKY